MIYIDLGVDDLLSLLMTSLLVQLLCMLQKHTTATSHWVFEIYDNVHRFQKTKVVIDFHKHQMNLPSLCTVN